MDTILASGPRRMPCPKHQATSDTEDYERRFGKPVGRGFWRFATVTSVVKGRAKLGARNEKPSN
jgi:hypothetical protein